MIECKSLFEHNELPKEIKFCFELEDVKTIAEFFDEDGIISYDACMVSLKDVEDDRVINIPYDIMKRIWELRNIFIEHKILKWQEAFSIIENQ
jgi:hypothetical protein